MSIVWLNGELLAEERAVVPALDRGVLWGYGLFETMRAYEGRVWAFDDHYERMRTGAEVVDIQIPDAGLVSGALKDVLEANELADAGVRVTITAGTGPADPQSEPTGPASVLVTAWPLRDYTDLYAEGAALATVPGGGRPLAGLKTTSYVVSVAGRVIAHRAGADDALFVGDDGRVLEATGSNLFAFRGNALVTPPLTQAVLPGVTRRHVLSVADRIGIETVEEPLMLDDLFAADEVVLTSSLREVYPARSIDGRDLKRCGVAEKLRDAYHAAVLEAL
ncbi:MAG TPA: aminotransferase class IV [Actinomycetota bacterium]|jgi:branched-subunit amino acid aminotransferase/4-amino-4-deoxychorismate lyase|nr:aminotransferase class IV [Actinomycetota bacterium]